MSLRLEGAYLDRFLARTDRESGAPCWLWNGAHFASGYPETWNGVRPLLAHRVRHEMWNGPIPEGYEVDHLCVNRRCLNPEHLEAVPPIVNNLRSRSAGAMNARKTHCPQGHPYDEANTMLGKGKWRRCRECKRQQRPVAEPRAPRTHCSAGHEFTPEHTYIYIIQPEGWKDRRCRECMRAADRRHRAKRRGELT